MICTPCGDNKVTTRYLNSLLDTQYKLAMNNIGLYTHIFKAGSLLVSERNGILQNFYNSDATHLLMIDSDIGWNADDVIRWIKMDKEFISGVYPTRDDSKRYAWIPKLDNDKIEMDFEYKLFKAIAVPAGFVMIKKSVLQKMIETHSDKKLNTPKGIWYMLFDIEVNDGNLWGEDFVFAKRANESNVEVLVDPNITLCHGEVNGTLINNI